MYASYILSPRILKQYTKPSLPKVPQQQPFELDWRETLIDSEPPIQGASMAEDGLNLDVFNPSPIP